MNESVSEGMNKWVNGGVSAWISEWMSEWEDEWMSECVSEQISEWLNEWISEWMNGQLSGWVSEWMSECVCGQMDEWVDEGEWQGGVSRLRTLVVFSFSETRLLHLKARWPGGVGFLRPRRSQQWLSCEGTKEKWLQKLRITALWPVPQFCFVGLETLAVFQGKIFLGASPSWSSPSCPGCSPTAPLISWQASVVLRMRSLCIFI